MEPFSPFRFTSGKKGGGRTASFFLPTFYSCLPPVMCKGAIRLGHPMGIFLFLNCRAPIIGRIDKFCSQFLLHRFLAALARRLDQPPHAHRTPSLHSSFYRHL